MAPAWFDATPGTQVVRLTRPARYRRTYDSVTFDEVDQELADGNCRACGSHLEFDDVQDNDVVGGKHFAYRTRACLWCGWWQIFKFREDARTNEIFWCEILRPSTEVVAARETFCFDESYPDIACLMRYLVRNPGDLHRISWQAFQNLVGQYLLDHGVLVKDISFVADSFGDFLCVDTNGCTAIVEVKHTKKPVTTDVPVKLLGVLQMNREIRRGMIVSTVRMTRDALFLVEHGSIPPHPPFDGPSPLTHVGLHQLCRWLKDGQAGQIRDLLTTISGIIADDAMLEM